jgi:hypothetical protein
MFFESRPSAIHPSVRPPSIHPSVRIRVLSKPRKNFRREKKFQTREKISDARKKSRNRGFGGQVVSALVGRWMRVENVQFRSTPRVTT